VDHGRNCYSYEKFGYITINCRDQEIIGKGRRLEYGDNENNRNNFNGKEILIVLN